MTKWLSRQEKVCSFQSYLKDLMSEEDESVNELSSIASHSKAGLVISQRPAVLNQTISSIQRTHCIPSFSLHLQQYLNRLLPQGESIPRMQLAGA